MDVSLFADPWEHIRLLSDGPRNAALVGFLTRHAPGRRVLEVGCGSGLLSLIAARLGASEVIAVEPTPMVEIARALAARNGLTNLTVLEGRIEDLEPRPVDLVFSELLNADPFFEGVVQVSEAARPWLAPGGRIAPGRLRVYAALVRASDSAREARSARREIDAIARRHALDLGPLLEAIGAEPPHRFATLAEAPLGPPALLWDQPLGAGAPFDRAREAELTVDEAGPVGGVMLWFEAPLDAEHVLHNRPGEPSHWGQQVCAFTTERGLRAGGSLRVRFTVDARDELNAAVIEAR